MGTQITIGDTLTMKIRGIHYYYRDLTIIQVEIPDPLIKATKDKLAQLITYPNVTVYSAIAGLDGLDLELVRTSDLLLDINPGRKVVEILDAFRFENKPILGFEDLKSTKHNQQTYSRDRWKEMAETIRQMRKKSL